jgi:hypothetical protein
MRNWPSRCRNESSTRESGPPDVSARRVATTSAESATEGVTAAAGAAEASGGLGRFEGGFEVGNLVAQRETALLEAFEGELVDRRIAGRAIDHVVQIRMLDAELDEVSMGRMQILDHHA